MQQLFVAILCAILLLAVGSSTSVLAIKQAKIGQHIPIDEPQVINSVNFVAKKGANTEGRLIIQVVQEREVSSTIFISANLLSTRYSSVEVEFRDPIEVTGNFDIVFVFEGKGNISLKQQSDSIPGNMFIASRELRDIDLVLTLNTSDDSPRYRLR